MIRRDYKASSFSPLNQITAQNVHDLRQVWSWAMQDGAVLGNQPAPIVHNGVLYGNNNGMVLQALDARTGELIWENRYGTKLAAPAMRGITIYGDKIFVATTEAHLMAFDARNGKVIWDTTMGDRSQGPYSTTSGPIAVNGKLSQNLGGCGTYRKEKCFISAYDAATGKEVWRFNTIAVDGEPGGDTWGGLPNVFRAGSESWITGSHDPDLNLTYWGTAQSQPWMRVSRGSGNGATLYASSTLALNADTGKLVCITITRLARRWIWMKFSSACWWMTRASIMCSARAKPAFCGSWNAKQESTSATKKWFSRMCTTPSIPPQASRTTATSSSNSASGRG
jgi:alcohol dehydrogenase (cytochrome c)